MPLLFDQKHHSLSALYNPVPSRVQTTAVRKNQRPYTDVCRSVSRSPPFPAMAWTDPESAACFRQMTYLHPTALHPPYRCSAAHLYLKPYLTPPHPMPYRYLIAHRYLFRPYPSGLYYLMYCSVFPVPASSGLQWNNILFRYLPDGSAAESHPHFPAFFPM